VKVTPVAAAVGAPMTLTAVIDDTRYDSNGWGNEPIQDVVAARYTVDGPSWVTGTQSYPMSPSDGAFDASVEVVQVAVDTAGWAAGRHILFVEGQDADGNWGAPTAAFVWFLDSAIVGTVWDGEAGGVIEGAAVGLTADSLEQEQLTGPDGHYTFAVFSGTHTLAASAPGYLSPVLTQVVALSGVTHTYDITLWPFRPRSYLPLIVH
jgi:hypothetical protein